jgi:hypothetical protein
MPADLVQLVHEKGERGDKCEHYSHAKPNETLSRLLTKDRGDQGSEDEDSKTKLDHFPFVLYHRCSHQMST